MATYAREKAARQSLLRQVRSRYRLLKTRTVQLERCLDRKRRAKTMLDPEDVSEIYQYTDAMVNALNEYQEQLGNFAVYIGSS